MPKVTLFTSSTCPHCHTAKDYLKEKGVEFEERNIQNDPEARKELIQKGYMGVPVIVVGEEEIQGFDRERLDAIL